MSFDSRTLPDSALLTSGRTVHAAGIHRLEGTLYPGSICFSDVSPALIL